MQASNTTNNTLRVGAYKTDITPPLDQTRRYDEKNLASDVIGTFCARAIVLADGKEKVAIVLIDVMDFYDNITRGIRDRVAKWTDIDRKNVMVCATHVHAGPVLVDRDGEPGDCTTSADTEAYINILCRKAASAVLLADNRLVPASARIAEVPLPGIGRPSRIRLKDGSIVSLGNSLGIKDIPSDQIESESPYDDTLRLAVFENPDGKPICALANFGCHNNIALSTTTLNTDFFGYAMDRIENKFANDEMVMAIMAGPQGDVQPLAKIYHRTWIENIGSVPPGRGDDQVPIVGEILRTGIEEAWRRLKPLCVGSIGATSEFVSFPWRKSPTPMGIAYIKSRKVAGGEQDELGAVAELQIIRIGDLAVFAICGEVFQEIGINLRKQSPFAHTWVTALANDRLLYLLPEWEYRRELISGKGNVQFNQVITDESAESRIYAAFEKMSCRNR